MGYLLNRWGIKVKLTKPQIPKKMKNSLKLSALALVITVSLASCNSASTEAKKVDSAATATVDTASKMVDSAKKMADTAKKMVDSAKSKMGKMADSAKKMVK